MSGSVLFAKLFAAVAVTRHPATFNHLRPFALMENGEVHKIVGQSDDGRHLKTATGKTIDPEKIVEFGDRTAAMG